MIFHITYICVKNKKYKEYVKYKQLKFSNYFGFYADCFHVFTSHCLKRYRIDKYIESIAQPSSAIYYIRNIFTSRNSKI